MNRVTPPKKEGAAADASGLRPLPSSGDFIKYKSRFCGDLYVAKVMSVDAAAGTATIDVCLPGSADKLPLTNVHIHRGDVTTCPKGACFL